MLQVPNLVKSDLVFNERLTEFSVDIYTEPFAKQNLHGEGSLIEWDVIHTLERSKKYLNKELKIMIRIKQ